MSALKKRTNLSTQKNIFAAHTYNNNSQCPNKWTKRKKKLLTPPTHGHNFHPNVCTGTGIKAHGYKLQPLSCEPLGFCSVCVHLVGSAHCPSNEQYRWRIHKHFEQWTRASSLLWDARMRWWNRTKPGSTFHLSCALVFYREDLFARMNNRKWRPTASGFSLQCYCCQWGWTIGPNDARGTMWRCTLLVEIETDAIANCNFHDDMTT